MLTEWSAMFGPGWGVVAGKSAALMAGKNVGCDMMYSFHGKKTN